jgi:glycosyltransferase involved in cell wall biosynthesis
MPARAITFFHKIFALVKVLLRSSDVDIVLIQKVVPPQFFQRLLSHINFNLVYDFDDAIFTTPTGVDPSRCLNKSHLGDLHSILELSKCVIAGNDYLANYARKYNRNVQILPSSVDCLLFQPGRNIRRSDRVTIGWLGSGEQHLPHLKMMKDIILKLGREIPLRLVLVGSMGSSKFQQLFADPSNIYELEVVDWVPFEHLPEVISGFDIGIMPLVDDPWTRGKCGYKALLYLACGVPAVCSPVGINQEIIVDSKNGMLAVTPEEWFLKLRTLITNPALLHKLGQCGRNTITSQYALDTISERLANILKLALATTA